jgi:pimeloyl-ACP methyl ester carboxylesterase
MSGASERLRTWRAAGVEERFRGRRIHVHPPGQEGGEGPLLVLLHGYPSSSFDFAALLEHLPGRDALVFDFLGFGLSAKPRDHRYSLLWQADLCEELVARHGLRRPVLLVAHDMGTSVATELLARDIAGRLSFEMVGALLFNGSIVLERASLTWSQRLLRSPLGPLATRLTSEPLFRRQFADLFSEGHPISAVELQDQWAQIVAGGGRTMMAPLLYYLEERVELADRWHGAIRDWPGALGLLWGLEDPVATVEVLAALRDLRPEAPVIELDGVGHYPQIEVPERVASAVLTGLGPLL